MAQGAYISLFIAWSLLSFYAGWKARQIQAKILTNQIMKAMKGE
jgi:hypothetical protein